MSYSPELPSLCYYWLVDYLPVGPHASSPALNQATDCLIGCCWHATCPTRPPDGLADPFACPEGLEVSLNEVMPQLGEDSGRSWQGFGTRPPGEGLTNRCVHVSVHMVTCTCTASTCTCTCKCVDRHSHHCRCSQHVKGLGGSLCAQSWARPSYLPPIPLTPHDGEWPNRDGLSTG